MEPPGSVPVASLGARVDYFARICFSSSSLFPSSPLFSLPPAVGDPGVSKRVGRQLYHLQPRRFTLFRGKTPPCARVIRFYSPRKHLCASLIIALWRSVSPPENSVLAETDSWMEIKCFDFPDEFPHQ